MDGQMSKYYNPQRSRNLYRPGCDKPFRVSRSKIDLFNKCPRCFYIDRRLGTGQPPGYSFAINSAVDSLLKKVDVVLLETGLGGRLDATNTVKRPAMSVITPVSMDHQQFLGGTLAEIAAEKAGILKHGVVCVLARQAPEAAEVIRAKAEALGALLYEQDSDWTVGVDGAELIYEGPLASRRLPTPSLVGSHQIGNAGVAVAALDRLV